MLLCYCIYSKKWRQRVEIRIKEQYKGELDDKKNELLKALYPNDKKMKYLKVPERTFRIVAFKEILKFMTYEYKKTLINMWNDIDKTLKDIK